MRLEPPAVLDEDVTLLATRKISGVYFLCLDDEVVYIGQSPDVTLRVHSPNIAATSWDRAYYLPCALEDLKRIERMMICKYQPRYNRGGCLERKAA